MKLTPVQVKGLAQCFIAEGIDPQRLRLHISEVEPGKRSHAAHTHAGIEVFYVLEGQATVEVEGDLTVLGANEAAVIDGSRPHGIFNAGSARIRYLVLITQ